MLAAGQAPVDFRGKSYRGGRCRDARHPPGYRVPGLLRHVDSAIYGAAPSSTFPNELEPICCYKMPFSSGDSKTSPLVNSPVRPPLLSLRGAGTGPASGTALQRPQCAAARIDADLPRRGAAGLTTPVTVQRASLPRPAAPPGARGSAAHGPSPGRRRSGTRRPRPPPPRGDSKELSHPSCPRCRRRSASRPFQQGRAAQLTGRGATGRPSAHRAPQLGPGPAALAATRPRHGPARDVTP